MEMIITPCGVGLEGEPGNFGSGSGTIDGLVVSLTNYPPTFRLQLSFHYHIPCVSKILRPLIRILKGVRFRELGTGI